MVSGTIERHFGLSVRRRWTKWNLIQIYTQTS